MTFLEACCRKETWSGFPLHSLPWRQHFWRYPGADPDSETVHFLARNLYGLPPQPRAADVCQEVLLTRAADVRDSE